MYLQTLWLVPAKQRYLIEVFPLSLKPYKKQKYKVEEDQQYRLDRMRNLIPKPDHECKSEQVYIAKANFQLWSLWTY